MKVKVNFKYVAIVLFVSVLISCGSSKTSTEDTTKTETLAELKAKEYKNKIKEFEKKGLEISGTSRSVEVALKMHYNNLDTDKYTEIVVDTENCPTVNLCSRKSLTDAAAEYATLSSSFLKGRVTSEAGYDAANQQDNLAKDRFYGAYEQKIAANISNVLKKSFSVIRKETSGYFYQTYYLVETQSAKKARLQAAAQANQETQQNIQWGTSISDYINQTPTKD